MNGLNTEFTQDNRRYVSIRSRQVENDFDIYRKFPDVSVTRLNEKGISSQLGKYDFSSVQFSKTLLDQVVLLRLTSLYI